MRIGPQDADNLNQIAHATKGLPYIPRQPALPVLINTSKLNLNHVGDEIRAAMTRLLKEKNIQDYRQVQAVLNDELCEKYLFFQLEIDSLPELNWTDGSQMMSLRCVKHLPCKLPKSKKKKKKSKKENESPVNEKRSVGLFENDYPEQVERHSQDADMMEDESNDVGEIFGRE